jgi:hypothetical protein
MTNYSKRTALKLVKQSISYTELKKDGFASHHQLLNTLKGGRKGIEDFCKSVIHFNKRYKQLQKQVARYYKD